MTPTWAVLIYGTFVVGGLSVYLLMPSPRKSVRTAGALFGLAALAGAMVLCGSEFLSGGGTSAYFYPAAAVAIFAAVKMITHQKPVYSALYFVLVVLAVAWLLLLQSAEFLAVALVIIYAGAILVTYVFVIMLAQQSGQPSYDARAREPFAAVFAGFLLAAVVAGATVNLPQEWAIQGRLASDTPMATADTTAEDNTYQIGTTMLAQYMVSLEIAGVLLLAAMIGAIAVTRKRVPSETEAVDSVAPGKRGREAAPF